MSKKQMALALAVVLFGIVAQAAGFDMILSSGSGQNMVTSQKTYELDISTSLKDSMIADDDSIYGEFEAAGSGDNYISISSSAKDKSVSTEMESKGGFNTDASSFASKSGVAIDQDAALSGSYGGLTSTADSNENKMVISCGFDGEGDLTSNISPVAGERAEISGSVDALGISLLDSESMQIVGSGDMAMNVEGVFGQSSGSLGTFGASASNTNKGTAGSGTSKTLTGPDITATGGDEDAYLLAGWRWNTKDPQLKLVLKTDNYLKNEGLTSSSVTTALVSAANTWDSATNQNIFADSNLVTTSSTVATDKYNKINTVNWQPVSSTCLAYSRTWYSTKKVDGYMTALDSDIVFNTKYTWKTDGSSSGIDVQSVGLHELGHTLGLGDLYGKEQYTDDTDQVMHYYTGVKRTLGNGDKTGIWKLYG